MTVLVYGSVALLVKMDDVGLWLAKRGSAAVQGIGRGLVKAMPWVFRTLSIVGVIAMLWVGGHILLANLSELGVPWPFDLVHAVTHLIEGIAALAWLVESALSAVAGLIWGAVIVLLLGFFARLRHRLRERRRAG